MKKTIILFAVVALVAAGSYVVFANEQMGGGMMRGGMMRGGMTSGNENKQQEMGQGSMMGGMRGRDMMGADMMGMGAMMNSSSIVATQDGGVVVLMGNELFKYDKDLSLVKQTEIKFNWENWQQMMMQHRNMMMQNRGMMMGGQSSSK